MDRASGILLHPSSLPSGGGIGDFGPAAYEFIDFLARARQSLWQILPLGPLGAGNSPYSALSAFAGNPLFISLDRLAERGWIEHSLLRDLPGASGSTDYAAAFTQKLPLIRKAARNFLAANGNSHRSTFDLFCRANSWWLDDWALFLCLKDQHHGAPWNQWSRELARREPDALDRARRELHAQLEVEKAVQFAFFEQWRAIHAACAARGIRIIGDVAIFVSYDSADVWTNPHLFRLNQNLDPEVVAGVPPDAFSDKGQRWGNPLYRWDVLKSHGYDWWISRIRWSLETCDLLRLDHFRGFEKYWEIPAHEETAVNGRWVEGPNQDLFQAFERSLGGFPFIVEDLGYITDEVHALRARLQAPGMKVLQFGFGNSGAHIYLPHHYEPNCVVYTGTHDNDTTLGWWQNGASAEERNHVRCYLGEQSEGMHWAFIRAAAASPARYSIVPLQDVLGLGSEGRMNVPSRSDGNWTWRYQPGALQADLADRLAHLVDVTDRRPDAAAGQQSHWEAPEQFAA